MKRTALFLSVACLVLAPLRAMGDPPKALNLSFARQLAQAAFDCAKPKNMQISVAIVNAEGNLVLFNRDDRAYVGSIAASIAKAQSANAFQRPTSAFTQSIKDGRSELLTLKEIVAIPGGVPIQLEGQHVGALGISGGRAADDEACALAALAKFK